MPVLQNIGQLATCRGEGGQAEIHPIADAALVWEGERIVWVGPQKELPAEWASGPAEDARHRLVVPGLIDCHTHLVFGGWRGGEFRDRILGRTYQEIAAAGGGILETVRQTRQASEEALFEKALADLREIAALGVTAVECKSGYGLSTEAELKILRVCARLAREQPLQLISTFLGAHAVPPEFCDRREAYIELLCEEMIPRAAGEGQANFCDVFVEQGAFSASEGERILETGRRHGLLPKVHADQLSDGGGAELAVRLGAVSADHLEHVSPDGIRALARAATVAVSLPMASLYLRQPPLPARRLIEAGIPVAVATDFNPGSAPSFHLPLAMTLAPVMQRMTPQEVLKGSTLYAARAVGLEKEMGSLEPGKLANFALVDAPDVTQWLYHFRANACEQVYVRGKPY